MIPSNWTQNDLKINKVKLHYYRTGDGSKPPLVLVHGFSDNGLCWLQTALDLEADYDIIMPDARGHGLSERVQPGQEVDMTTDLAGLILSLGLEEPIVGGHSMGAAISFQLGVRYPEIPRALILEDPPWWQPQNRSPMPEGEHPMAGFVDTINRQSLDEFIAQTRSEHPDWPEWVINTWCPAKKQLDPNILSILRIEGADWSETLPKLQCPILIVTADPDKGGIITPEIAARAQELNPRCRVTHIPGTGHHVRFEKYDTYMRAIRAFLGDVKN